MNGVWTQRELWFVGGQDVDKGSSVGQHKPFETEGIPERVRISVEDERTDDWGYWKLALKVQGEGEGCNETIILVEPAASEGPPRTFGSEGVANWEITRTSKREELSRSMPQDEFYDWHNWWLGEGTSMFNTYDIGIHTLHLQFVAYDVFS